MLNLKKPCAALALSLMFAARQRTQNTSRLKSLKDIETNMRTLVQMWSRKSQRIVVQKQS